MTPPTLTAEERAQLRTWFERPETSIEHLVCKTLAALLVAEQRAEKVGQQFIKHTKAVGEWMSDLYAIMIDPLADGPIRVQETMRAIKEAALRDRETAQRCSDLQGHNAALITELATLQAQLDRQRQEIENRAWLALENERLRAAMADILCYSVPMGQDYGNGDIARIAREALARGGEEKA